MQSKPSKFSDVFRPEFRDLILPGVVLASLLKLHPGSMPSMPFPVAGIGPRRAKLYRVGDIAAHIEAHGLGYRKAA